MSDSYEDDGEMEHLQHSPRPRVFTFTAAELAAHDAALLAKRAPVSVTTPDLSRAIREAVRVGQFGENATAIITRGGDVALTPHEADAAAEKLAGWMASLGVQVEE